MERFVVSRFSHGKFWFGQTLKMHVRRHTGGANQKMRMFMMFCTHIYGGVLWCDGVFKFFLLQKGLTIFAWKDLRSHDFRMERFGVSRFSHGKFWIARKDFFSKKLA